jgi:hypothetical protein
MTIKNQITIHDQLDGNYLVIHPEVNNFYQYEKLAYDNKFLIEMSLKDLKKVKFTKIDL